MGLFKAVQTPTRNANNLSVAVERFEYATSIDNSGSDDSVVTSSLSFRYDPSGTGFKSTQQLNVDWSRFDRHCFFNSAQVKTTVTFQRILNDFPFDGTREEVETFIDSLSGFEKYILSVFPSCEKTYLFLSGTSATETTALAGTFVTGKDQVGTDYPTLARLSTAKSILDPGTQKPFTLEFQFYLPEQSNENSVVYQKHHTGSFPIGLSLVLSESASTTDANLLMYVYSGSAATQSSNPVRVTKGEFQHVAFLWDRQKIYGYVNHQLVNSSSNVIEITDLNTSGSNFIIGSGSVVVISPTSNFVPVTTLSGAVDELRFWHSLRTKEQREQNEKKNVFASPNLKLYYKFNECSGSTSGQIVVDSSGNALHGTLSTAGYSLGVRNRATGSVPVSPMLYEKAELNPVLFPDYIGISELQDAFLSEAEVYDQANPCLITKLFPPHFFLTDLFRDNEEGTIVDGIDTTAVTSLRNVRSGETQALLSLLWLWAKFFDEIKLYTDAITDSSFIGTYNEKSTVPDQFLQFLAEKNGIKLPTLFNGSSVQGFINGENVYDQVDLTENSQQYTLQYIQNQIWRRILINIKDILTSKGTLHSLKAFVRALGIDPDNNFRIKEYGGATTRALDKGVSREQRSEVVGVLSFVSGGLISSPYLSGTRTEVGYPNIAGNASDGLYTSGSWTVEGIYRHGTETVSKESLARLYSTGSLGEILWANLVFSSGSGLLTLNVAPSGLTSSSGLCSLTLSASQLASGQAWNWCFGRKSSESMNTRDSWYFLNLGRYQDGRIEEFHSTGVFVNDVSSYNIQSNVSSSFNASGSWLEIGSGTVDPNLTSSIGLNQIEPTTYFSSKLNQLRFWSKALTLTEFQEHILNFKSLGTEARKNFNFITNQSGSFERLRIDASMDQYVTSSDSSGNILLQDFSQNNLNLSGTGFVTSSTVINPTNVFYSFISPNFDEGVTTNKIRIRSLNDPTLQPEASYIVQTPTYDTPLFESPSDNNKVSIDFSVVDLLNQDMITMFATLDEFNNVIGNPELVFATEYPDLTFLREVYFNRLQNKVNLRTFFEFYKWFDTNIGSFLAQLLSRKTRFSGTNYVIESHMLERPKVAYKYVNAYLGESTKPVIEPIQLANFSVSLSKY